MDLAREWTLAVCMACVASGVMQYFSAKNERPSVIKLVLTLYILVTAFAPLQALRYPDTRALPSLPSAVADGAQPVDTDALVLAQAQESLAATLRQACESQGATLTRVKVTLAQSEQGVVVQQVVFAAQDTAKTETARNAIRGVLGQEVPLAAEEDDHGTKTP